MLIKLRLLCLIAVLFCLQPLSFSQQANRFTALADDPAQIRSWTSRSDEQHKDLLKNLPKAYRKDYEQIYTDRYKHISELTAKGKIITDAAVTNYLQQLVSAISSNNPAIREKLFRVCFSREYWPNAYSIGEGTIVFNIGLFTKLRNESQVAFVLCHEIAHYYLQHGQQSIDRFVSTINSDQFRDELKRIRKSTYLQNRQMQSLMKGVTFTSRRHSREFESAADSLALEWMKNTPFKLAESLSCLALLDSVDTDKYNVSPAPEKVFNFPQYPFQKQWIQQEQSLLSSMAGHSQAEERVEDDSLKTHPDCSKRVQQLSARVNSIQVSNANPNPVNEALFLQLQNNFDYEIIDYCYKQNEISRSLYYSLQMLQSFPGDPYLVSNTGRCLNALFQAQKDHMLTKVADMPSPYFNKKYDLLLQFIQRVRLSDIAAFSYYYLLPYENKGPHAEEMLQALIISKQNFNKPDEKQRWIDQYKKQYPQGKYTF